MTVQNIGTGWLRRTMNGKEEKYLRNGQECKPTEGKRGQERSVKEAKGI